MVVCLFTNKITPKLHENDIRIINSQQTKSPTYETRYMGYDRIEI